VVLASTIAERRVLSFFAGCFQFQPIPATMAAELGRANRSVGNPSLRSVACREQPGIFSNLISVVDLTELQSDPMVLRPRCDTVGMSSGCHGGCVFSGVRTRRQRFDGGAELGHFHFK
jgi:hypothetical protein